MLGGVIATRWGSFTDSGPWDWCSCCRAWATRRPRPRTPARPLITAAALFENFAAGLGTAAFLAFLMSVCERRYAATQFALLSAIFALSRWAAGLMSGVLAERLGFAAYFFLTFLLGLPAFLLLRRVRHAAGSSSERVSPGRAPSRWRRAP